MCGCPSVPCGRLPSAAVATPLPLRTGNAATSGNLRVVVVVPTFNRRDLLMKTLESLRRLEIRPDHCTVVSDGSTDGSDEMAKNAGFTVLRTDRRQAAGARNRGWREAEDADVIAFIDDDC